MAITVEEIRFLSKSIYLDLSEIIDHDSEVTISTWGARLETGKALEVLSLCTLASAAISIGCHVHIPEIFNNNPDLFYLRNVLHRHHGAQPGHEGIGINVSLQDQFVASLTPKFVIQYNDIEFGVYREGFPIHLVEVVSEGKPEYLDRPDILIVEGNVTVSTENHKTVNFSYESSRGTCEGVLRVKNDIRIPLIKYTKNLISNLPIHGIIECSIGKSKEKAEDQLLRYLAIFSGTISPATLLVNGRNKPCEAYDFIAYIDLVNGNINDLRDSLVSNMCSLLTKAINHL